MSKNPDHMGEQLNGTVFLISTKCASCKEYMDFVNDRFDPGSCNSVVLDKSGLGETDISSFKFDKIRGKSLVNLKEACDRDRKNHSDRYIESNDVAELQSGVQVEVPHGQNQDIETMSQSISDSHLYADTAELSAINPWQRRFGSSNTAESFDPRRTPLISASLRFAPQVPQPSTLTLRAPVDVSGQYELPYNPSSEIHEVPGDCERVTDSQGGGYFDPS
ncbi:hypothetical protein I203_100469 [Kwoniella mangroviensis CBS 8507]|uniref:uncharacterized protein n=1 Tax=Kwoniella mangroviensis CBS 8507 TaxID=1296122 RepID=UPI00080D3409|nr:uncharacterized protein I203_07042 [Kwoniella mangroviensis CBS 8507]OCF63723.1 hypothetical protein I203_07042 [Kwoniella mangroviensis CBS 8507]